MVKNDQTAAWVGKGIACQLCGTGYTLEAGDVVRIKRSATGHRNVSIHLPCGHHFWLSEYYEPKVTLQLIGPEME